jgi:ribosomal-protein-alanine acetyltransferase
MSIAIEKATVDDLETLCKIEIECFSGEAFSNEQIAALLRSPNSISLLAKMHDEVVGFIILLLHKNEDGEVGHVYTLDVAEKARKRGIGRRLLEEAEQILRKNRAKACYLEVGVDNTAARRLYKKMGYVEIELLKGFYQGKDGVRLKRDLR